MAAYRPQGGLCHFLRSFEKFLRRHRRRRIVMCRGEGQMEDPRVFRDLFRVRGRRITVGEGRIRGALSPGPAGGRLHVVLPRLSLTETAKGELGSRARELRLPREYAVVHLRGTDHPRVKRHAGGKLGLARQLANEARFRSGSLPVYVASDDAAMVRAFTESLGRPARFVSPPQGPRGAKGCLHRGSSASFSQKRARTLDALFDLSVMAHAGVFIGSRVSGFTKLARELRRSPHLRTIVIDPRLA